MTESECLRHRDLYGAEEVLVARAVPCAIGRGIFVTDGTITSTDPRRRRYHPTMPGT
ncbi:MAG TPA: hypothetical protein VIL69_20370 [Roseomonas sp.]|jgi:hypothetical protein